MTPEGKVKKAIREWLAERAVHAAGTKAFKLCKAPQGWYYMPVQNGMGVTGIPDFVGNIRGHFFAIEAKAPNKKPTPNQEQRISEISASGGVALVIDQHTDLSDRMHAGLGPLLQE